MGKQSYHHGDLRRALLDAAAEVIAESGPVALSLRDLARRAGVSHAAPAHHFGDKAGLLTALATEGYERLYAELQASGGEGFLGLGVAYVRFALANPAHFEVMFQPSLFHTDEPVLSAARERARAALYAGAGELTGEAGQADAERLAGLAGWSMAHGFAMLKLSGSMPQSHATPDQEARAVLGQLAAPRPA
jgi:AcrR family transcriptional regulator